MKGAISGRSSVVAAKDPVSCDLDGEAVILSVRNGIYYGLDGVGARVWSIVQEPRTVDEIRNILLKEYDVEADRCERDLLDLLQELAANGLIEIGDEVGA
jgi:hypothetical protein